MSIAEIHLIDRFVHPGVPGNKVPIITMRPVVKISFEGILLFANSAGIEFLELLSQNTGKPALNYLLKECPSILDSDCSLDINCTLNGKQYFFSVVAFKEAGYTGLYSYSVLHLNDTGKNVA